MRKVTLAEVLEKKTVEELKELASICEVKGYSKLRKAELINACADAINDEELFVEHLYLLSDKAWTFYRYVYGCKGDVIVDDAPIECIISESMGYLYSEEIANDKILFVIPEEIKALYKKVMDGGFAKIKERSDLIHSYAEAAVNLYGIIPQEELLEIFNSQNEEKTDIDEMFEVFLRNIGTTANYCLWEEYIVNNEFEEDDFIGVEHLAKRIVGKPRYVPDKAEFLEYSDYDYYEVTEQYSALNRFLAEELKLSIFELDDILDEVHYSIVSEMPIGETINVYYAYGIEPNEKQLRELIRLTVELSNNTRLWCNNGHTPNEIGLLYRNSRQKERKVGRNDPCPCGSGKKYKKCCGM